MEKEELKFDINKFEEELEKKSKEVLKEDEILIMGNNVIYTPASEKDKKNKIQHILKW